MARTADGLVFVDGRRRVIAIHEVRLGRGLEASLPVIVLEAAEGRAPLTMPGGPRTDVGFQRAVRREEGMMQTWGARQSSQTKASVALVGVVLACGVIAPTTSSSQTASVPTATVATLTGVAATRTPTAAPTATPATVITGMTTIDIEGNAKARGLSCGAPKTGSGTTQLQTVECLGALGGAVIAVTYASESTTRVRLLTASITPATASLASSRAFIDAAATYLGFWATMPYTGADPVAAQTWVKANVAKPGATTTIGPAFFEIDPAPSDIGTRRLNVVAVGARQ